MSTAEETSVRNSRNVARGKEAERQVARFLTVALDLPDDQRIVRYVRAGHARAGDPGDLTTAGDHFTGTGLICSVKDDLEIYRIPTWLDELDRMAGSPAAVRFLVSKWRQHPVTRWHVYTRAGMLVPLVTLHAGEAAQDGTPYLAGRWAMRTLMATPGDRLRTPVRLDLGAFSTMLAESGFGYHGNDQQREADHGSG